MKVLGLDPSLTNMGWALHDTEAPVQDAKRCLGRGRFQTPASMEFIDRNISQRESLRALIQRLEPDKIGIEFPIFGQMYSEGMYGLFLFCCEALKKEGCDVVFWAPLQVKAHARDTLVRPKGWKMDKVDMVEAAKLDAGGGRWNHNEADAYLVGVLSGRFWKLLLGELTEPDLTATEAHYFTGIKTYLKGRLAGRSVKKGVIYREDERFFAWSNRASTSEK